MENKVESFEDLFIWQESLQLCLEIYESLQSCRDFGLRDQMQKSSVSVSSNIAEGFERGSDKEFIRFLYYAKGSCGELRTQLYIAKGLKIIQSEKCLLFIDKSKRNASMIQNLIKKKKEDLKILKNSKR
jgi:four helix bundle protein